MTESSNPAPTAPPAAPDPTSAPASAPPDQSDWPVMNEADAAPSGVTSTVAAEPPAAPGQTSMAAPRGLSYAVDIVFGIDVSGSMTPILDQVKANALRFYDDVQTNLTAKGKNVDQLRVRVIAFRDFAADGEAALEESPFFTLPEERAGFSEFVSGLVAEGGGDEPESGLEAVALAIDSAWTTTGDRRRQVIVIWTDQPAQTLSPSVLPAGHRGAGARRLQRPDRRLGGRAGPDGLQLQAADPVRAGRSRLERHLRRLGERRASPLAGRRRAVRGRLRNDHRLDRQLGVSEAVGAWAHSAPSLTPGPTISFAFNLGKIPDQGEDSDPICREGPDLGLVAVFDGMGGAGGTVYETPDGRRTGAYIASRVARDVVERRMLDLLEPDWNLNGKAAALDLQRSVQSALQERLEELKAPPSGLRSRLLRALPTTMALVALQRTQPGGPNWTAHVLWAGDSRAYVLEPAGVRQLSTDDLRDPGDALANLRRDSVVSNAMSADTDFHINYRRVKLEAPFLVMGATDGCFGYVPTPMHFEDLVLRHLAAARTVDAWSAGLQEEISAITGDDAAMAVLGIGADFTEFKDLFAPRLDGARAGRHCTARRAARRHHASRAGTRSPPVAPGQRDGIDVAPVQGRVRALPASRAGAGRGGTSRRGSG